MIFYVKRVRADVWFWDGRIHVGIRKGIGVGGGCPNGGKAEVGAIST